MLETEGLAVLKALAHGSRLRIVAGLLDGPRCVEELAELLALSASTVSFHLDKLEKAGLVSCRRDQYYRVYSIDTGPLSHSLRELVQGAARDFPSEVERLEEHRRRVRSAFFKNGRLVRMPAQRRKRRVVLREFAALFKPGTVYPETEVNRIINRFFEDHCLVRRLLVEEGFMSRERQVYRKKLNLSEKNGALPSPRPSPDPDCDPRPDPAQKIRRRSLKAAYKLQPRTAGVFQVKNLNTGRLLLGSSLNLHGPFNRIRMELETGIIRNPDLLADWRAHGPDAFSFDVLETLIEEPDSGRSLDERLRELEEAWIEKLQPFGEKGYNREGRVRMA